MTVQGWHVNPETGEPGLCRAAISCPFGGEELHFDTESDARKFYEAKMSNYTLAELISKSEERTPWRSLSWPDRKRRIEDYVNSLVESNPKLKRKRVSVVWDPIVNDRAEVLGYGGDRKGVVHLTEGIEALEEVTVKTLIVHELAHVIEKNRPFGPREDHGEDWNSKAQSIAKDSAILEGIEYSKEANHTVLESLRRQTQKILLGTPQHIGRCSKRSHVFYVDTIPSTALCPQCSHIAYDLESRIIWSSWVPGSQDEKDYIKDQLGRVGFGKENQP